MLIRPRTDLDFDACAVVVEATRVADRYPAFMPASIVDLLAPPYLITAWVAEDDGRVVGHVALHEDAPPGVLDLAAARSAIARESLCVLARLFVAPDARRGATARALMDTAVDEARRRGRRAILDVLDEYTGAIALYDACGWKRLGEVTNHWDRDYHEFVYLSPEA